MLFNSFGYLFFLPLVFLIYWAIKGRRVQNLFVVAASFFFYACWDWRFLSLIIFTILSSWGAGLVMERLEEKNRMRIVVSATAIKLNLLILGCFKYFDFFAQSFSELLAAIGINANNRLDIPLKKFSAIFYNKLADIGKKYYLCMQKYSLYLPIAENGIYFSQSVC